MRTGFLLHPASAASSAIVSAGHVSRSWWWVCPIACGFIHNYSRSLELQLKHADGPGWTGASRQGASGRREDVGRPRSACFLRGEEDSGEAAAAAAAAEAEPRRLQPLAVVRLRSGGKLLHHRLNRPVPPR